MRWGRARLADSDDDEMGAAAKDDKPTSANHGPALIDRR